MISKIFQNEHTHICHPDQETEHCEHLLEALPVLPSDTTISKQDILGFNTID